MRNRRKKERELLRKLFAKINKHQIIEIYIFAFNFFYLRVYSHEIYPIYFYFYPDLLYLEYKPLQ